VLAHGRTSTGPDQQTARAEEFAVLAHALSALEALIERVDSLSIDSKSEAFHDLIGRLQSTEGPRAICIFVGTAATGAYLHSALLEGGRATLLITEEERTPRASIKHLSAQKGVLLVVDEALPAYDLRAFRRGVHYDLPADDQGWMDRFARLGVLDHEGDVMTYALVEAGRAARLIAD
jgi:hypothetical protein